MYSNGAEYRNLYWHQKRKHNAIGTLKTVSEDQVAHAVEATEVDDDRT